MKVAVDCYEVKRPVTGVGRVTSNLLTELAEIMPEDEFHALSREKYEGYKRTNIIQHIVLPDNGYFRWQNGPFRKKLKAVCPDILIASNYTLPIFSPYPSVLIEHDVSFISHPEWFPRRETIKKRWLVQRSVKKADSIVTVSDFSKAEILKYFHISSQKVKVILHGSDAIFRKSSAEEIERWRESKGLKGKKIIGFLGSIFNRRHIPELVDAVRLLREELPEVFLYVIGKDLTYPSQNIPQLLDKEWILWESSILDDKLPLFFSSLDLFAYLSEYEGFGLPPLEALSCGTVPVLLNRTSLKEIYSNTAFMVDHPDVKTVKPTLKAALTEVKERENILARFKKIKPCFSWRKAAEDMSVLLKNLYG